MTMAEFVRKVRDVARKQERPVLAVDFEPAKEGLNLRFRFKEDR